MTNLIKYLGQWVTIWLWIVLVVWISWISYSALSSLTATTSETLTADKWNALVEHAVPSWFVGSFALSACPTWWSEYTQAYGRVIRWIDKSWASIDPDGERAFWSTQEDDFKEHTHSTVQMIWDNAIDGVDSTTTNSWEHHNEARDTGVTGWTETRSKNVALLYCIKN